MLKIGKVTQAVDQAFFNFCPTTTNGFAGFLSLERFSGVSWREIWCFVVEFLWNLPEFSKKLLSLEKYRVRWISVKKACRILHTLHFYIIDLAKKTCQALYKSYQARVLCTYVSQFDIVEGEKITINNHVTIEIVEIENLWCAGFPFKRRAIFFYYLGSTSRVYSVKAAWMMWGSCFILRPGGRDDLASSPSRHQQPLQPSWRRYEPNPLYQASTT